MGLNYCGCGCCLAPWVTVSKLSLTCPVLAPVLTNSHLKSVSIVAPSCSSASKPNIQPALCRDLEASSHRIVAVSAPLGAFGSVSPSSPVAPPLSFWLLINKHVDHFFQCSISNISDTNVAWAETTPACHNILLSGHCSTNLYKPLQTS